MSTAIFIQNNFWGTKEEIVPFSPDDLVNLWQWYNPSAITSSTIVNWEDSSGNNNTMETVVGSVITGSLLNSLPTVYIGSSSAMQVLNDVVFDEPNQTVFMVVKPNYGIAIGDYGSTLNKLFNFALNGNDGETFRAFIRDTGGDILDNTVISIPNGKAAFNIYGIVLDGANSKYVVYDHTGSLYSASNASYATNTTFQGRYASLAYQTISGLGGTIYNEAVGDYEFAEIIIYQETKSVAEINDIGNYLSNKFALSWTDF